MNAPLITADQGFSSLARQMSRWMEHVLGPDYPKYHSEQAWSPSIDLYEDPSCFYVVADLAGVEAKTVDLRVVEGKLLLRGERRAPRPPAGGKNCTEPAPGPLRLHLMEVSHGPFMRLLELPESVDPDQMCACYKHGFLWVKMHKRG